MFVKILVALAAVLAVIILGLATAFAQGKVAQSTPVTVTGENYCLLDALGKTQTALPALVKLNALRVVTAKGGDGKVMPEFTGKTLHYLATKSAEALLTGDAARGREVSIRGKLFRNEAVLLVDSFEIQEDFAEIRPVRATTGLILMEDGTTRTLDPRTLLRDLNDNFEVDAKTEALKTVQAVITGENYCLLDTLGKSETALPALGKLNALRVATAKSGDGKVMPEFTGRTLHYLATKSAEQLLTGEAARGREVSVKGRLFKNESVLLVDSFEVQEDFAEVKPIRGVTGAQDMGVAPEK